MKTVELAFQGVKLFIPTYYEDNRGYSAETYNDKTTRECEIAAKFVVDYECCNRLAGTIRGIHFQNNPHPQTKLVRVLQGEVLDFVVDLRKGSPTYKRWISQVISAENRKQLYIPGCFGHAYVTRSPNTVVLYKFDDYYNRELVRAIRWDDPEIGIDWGITDPILSQQDANAPTLAMSDVNFKMEQNG